MAELTWPTDSEDLYTAQPAVEGYKSVGAVFGFDVAAAPFNVGPSVAATRDFAGAGKLSGEAALFAATSAAGAITHDVVFRGFLPWDWFPYPDSFFLWRFPDDPRL